MSRLRSLGSLSGPLARRALGKGGAGFGRVLVDWPSIAPDGAAARARPVKLTFPRGRKEGGTLTLAVTPGDALIVSHDLDRLRDRVNAFLGHAALARVKLVQTAAAAPIAPRRRPVGRREQEAIAETISPAASAELQAALTRIGRALWERPE